MLSTNVLCMKKRKKRSYYISEASDYIPRPSRDKRSPGDGPAMMQITEDTPPDMLAGAMDLTVHLPTGRTVKMSVERSTPMMDLLVQITTAYHLQHSGHIIQALEMAPSVEHADKILPYKPNTPIGALDTQYVKVIPKNRSISIPKHVSVGYQPFESTFRLQVHLPRNQLYVIRVSQNVYLEDIMKKVCQEKNLDSMKYEFRHPGNLDEVLDPKLTLSDYQITEVYIVSKGTVSLAQTFSSNDIMALRKEEERKQLQARTGGGVFSLIFKRGKPNMGSGSLSSDNRSISPSHSDDSRSVTPPALPQKILPPVIQEPPAATEKPKAPQRKRRPAPKPPQQTNIRNDSSEKPPSQISNASDSNTSDLQPKKVDSGLTICHSRNSSDSSGYHEPSVLSDNCNMSLPRRTKSTIINEVVNEEVLNGEPSRNNGNLTKMAIFSKSTTSITSRKKKAAPPPPAVTTKIENTVAISKNASPVVASPPVQIEVTDKQLKEDSTVDENKSSNDVVSDSQIENSTSTTPIKDSSSHRNSLSSREASCKNSSETRNVNNQPFLHTSTKDDATLSSKINSQHLKSEEIVELENDDWQYQLPSPPTAFRDSSPTNLTDVTNYDTITLQDFKDESVVTNPELFEKLKIVKEKQSETETVSDFNSDDEKPIFSKLTLENLEKRKSLVYNRELSTSLKIAQDSVSSSSNVNNKNVEETASKRSSMLSELEQVIHQNGSNKTLSRHNSYTTDGPIIDSNLPNFKISTYDKPKNKINIFEDDSVRSNVDNSFKTNSFTDLSEGPQTTVNNGKLDYNEFTNDKHSYIGHSMENISFRKYSLDNQDGDDVFKKPYEFSKHRSTSKNNFYIKHQSDTLNSMTRSESFSSNNKTSVWKPHNLVQRSKSQVALNKYRDGQETKAVNGDGLSKSSSSFDISGLHSLEVMRMIQTKLKTPSTSTEQIVDEKPIQYETKNPTNLNCNTTDATANAESDDTSTTKTYKYRGPPAINLSTWSERPKTKVSLKEDTDYKINTKDDQNQRISKNNCNGIEITHFSNLKNQEDSSVSIKINGTEHITTQESGNVVIKIGESQPPKTSNDFSSRFISHTTAMGYRKPLANINKIDKAPRPHSIAFDSDFDISRVPIVRSVELKKPFKDTTLLNNKSVTQINSLNTETSYKYTDVYRSTEAVNEINDLKPQVKHSSVYLSSEPVNKPVIRVNSFAQHRSVPVVVGFRGVENGNDNTARSRKSWNVPNNYSTLPPKANTETLVKNNIYSTNSKISFCQVALKQVDANKPQMNGKLDSKKSSFLDNVVLRNTSNQLKTNKYINNYGNTQKYLNGNDLAERPPPPPVMPKVTNVTKKIYKNIEPSVDPRNELLDSIRNFGGIKGLRHVKV